MIRDNNVNLACQILEFIRYKTFVNGRNIMAQKKLYSKNPISIHRKKFTVTERNILPQEEIYFYRIFIVAGRNLLS